MKTTSLKRLYDQPAGSDIDKWERIDASRKEVLLKICSSGVVALYKKMLMQATIEHTAEQGIIAVLTCSTIRALARSLHQGYDFILRCISIFKALGLLQHVTSRKHGTRLHFPLGSYLPLASLATLNNLIVSTRNRLSRLARQTKNLYIQHYGDPERSSYSNTIQQLKAACEQLLQGPLNQESTQLLYAQVSNLVACFQDAPQQGDLRAVMGDPKPQTDQHCPRPQGDSSSPNGDFYTAPGRPVLPALEDPSPQKGDFYTKKGDPSPQKGDFYTKKGDFYISKEDFYTSFELKKGGKVEEVETQVSSVSINDIVDNNIILTSSSSNDYVIDRELATFLKNEPPANRRLEAEQIRSEAMALAMFVENTPRNVASFIRKLSSNPLATRAAVIDLLVQTYMPDYQGKPRNRGAWLNRAYARYTTPGVLFPLMVKRWLYTQETWQEIEQTLAQETGQQSPPISKAAPTPSQQPTIPPLPPSDPTKNWLDEIDAIQLAAQIVHDGAEHGYMLRTEVVPDQAVWLVRVRWADHTLSISSQEHWRSEFAEIHAMLQARRRIPN
ncbi:hypothetical protein [Dictyobacter formicarum]|uniref:Uncharacterized protein n=1 Tax=Dictyobacter formicarum TaxID=2778368 RepID=A0ABQ3VRB9_9CHLR|nr:hypothetical protein [Dictyobacter formicarum]GHO88814.1 hypothetical protein KSZ_68200 [Dictyobacter formicarum]